MGKIIEISNQFFLCKVKAEYAWLQPFESLISRTMDTQREFFFENPKLLGLGRQIVPKISGAFGGIFGWFISTHFGNVSPLSMFSNNQPLFLQKKLSLSYPNAKYLFGIEIWIWAAKN